MRYALIADIHSNLEAFQAVIDRLSSERIDEFLCVGDIVGYASDPAVVIRLLESLKPRVVIAGNHDLGVAGLIDLNYFNDAAKAAIVWTKGVLSAREKSYLRKLPLIYELNDFTLVHGSLDHPEEFRYIVDRESAIDTFGLMETRLCFVGHSHIQNIFIDNGKEIIKSKHGEIGIEPGFKYVINIGSVGQPRDGDPRAGYAIYDSGSGDVKLGRVEYDVMAARKKIVRAGLPPYLALRLAEGR